MNESKIMSDSTPTALDAATATMLAELGACADVAGEMLDTILHGLRHNPFLISRSPDLDFAQLQQIPWPTAFNIIKGLTLAENAGISNYRGSVSLVKYAFRVLEHRDPVRSMEVAAWIVDHSDNIYIPFEVRKIRHVFEEIKCTAVSWEECHQRLNGWGSEESQRQSQAVQESREREFQATIRTAVRARCHAERQQLSAARARVRESFLHELSLLDPTSRIEHLAWDDKRDLSYYPDSFATVPPDSFASLDPETQARFLAKLRNRPKGVWRRLYQKITAQAEHEL